MQHVIDATEADFATAVIERSRSVPVLVDFWAEWCGPCRVLGPILERLAQQMEGRFVLAKVDTEQSPALAAQFGVRGIPDVKLFVDGTVRGGFTGAQPEASVRAFVEQHLPDPLDDAVQSARAALGAGDAGRAEALLRDVVAQEAHHAGARLLLARLALSAGDEASVREHVAALPPNSPEAREGEALVALFELVAEAQQAGSMDEVIRAVTDHPEDGRLRYALGGHLAALGRHAEAMDALLRSLVARGGPREKAHKALLTLFNVLGPAHPLTRVYRGKLQAVL